MKLKYLRLALFQRLKRPFADRSRAGRMRTMMNTLRLRPQLSILDLGGHPDIWQWIDCPLEITILNLPGAIQTPPQSRHRIRYVEGDACRVTGFEDRCFDLVFSNSVIEHVGPSTRQAEFAHEVRRLGTSYWVQTPAKWFPIEAHCGMPFWWFYPESLRQRILARWRLKLPDWTEMVEGTRVLTKAELRALFPEATIAVERVAGIPKSYVAYYLGNQNGDAEP